MGNTLVRAGNVEPRSFFLLEIFSSSRPGGRREKQIVLTFSPPASIHLLLNCTSSWSAHPSGQHPVAVQPQVESSCTARKGEGRLVSNGASLAKKQVCSKIPACLSGQLSLLWGSSIYFLGSLPSPEGIRSLECLNPEKTKSLPVLFFSMTEGANLWCALTRGLNCSTMGAAWPPEVGRASWQVLLGREKAAHRESWGPAVCNGGGIHWERM